MYKLHARANQIRVTSEWHQFLEETCIDENCIFGLMVKMVSVIMVMLAVPQYKAHAGLIDASSPKHAEYNPHSIASAVTLLEPCTSTQALGDTIGGLARENTNVLTETTDRSPA